MTANQRRPGFRLPWSPETDGPAAEGESSVPGAEATAEPTTTTAAEAAVAEPPEAAAAKPAEAAAKPGEAVGKSAESVAKAPEATPAAESVAKAPEATPAAESAAREPDAPGEPAADMQATAEPEATKADEKATPTASPSEASGGHDFMRDLVAAMRRVADEARQTSVSELRSTADERVRSLETDAERRCEELRARAEADVAGVGDWAKAEAERIKAEAAARVVARRAQLDQQVGADTTRTESETKVLRRRVAEYERELEAYHAQLAEINDPAAFAAAAKRMPRPPALAGANGTGADGPAAASAMSAVASEDQAALEPATGASNGVPAPMPEVHPAEEEVLAARLAELDATLPEPGAAAVATSSEPMTTEIVVKGLGSFGAITGFRQALSGVHGIAGVALSLGQTGEFVFRATHATGFNVRSAITTLEGDGAKVEDRPEGGLRVTLDRAR